GRRVFRRLLVHKLIACEQAFEQRGLWEQGGPALPLNQLAIAGGGIPDHVIAQAFKPLWQVVGQILVLRHGVGYTEGSGADVRLAAIVATLPVTVATRLLAIVGIGGAEEPAQADFLMGGEQAGTVAASGRVRRRARDPNRQEALSRQLSGRRVEVEEG